MSALLEDRVCAWLHDHPDATFAEVQRAVPCLTRTLETILEEGPFDERDGRWRIAGTTGKHRRGQFGPVLTQKQRILAVLRDGRWHTATELYRTGCVLHSRISDLRNKDGYRIERRNVGGVGADAHEYRLLEPDTVSVAGSVSGSSGPGSPDPGAPHRAARTDGQLVMTGPEFRRSAA